MTVNSPALNEWGVPDWRDASAYPDGNSRLAVWWAWQGLRRQPAFRDWWIKNYTDEGIDGDQAVEMRRLFGILIPVPPNQSEPSGLFWDGSSVEVSWKDQYTEPKNFEERKLFRDAIIYKIAFHLDRPLKEQLERAASWLYARQQHQADKDLFVIQEPRAALDKYPTYMRIIDADESGASDEEICSILYPRLDSDQQRLSLRNHRNAARKFRDGGYRAIAYKIGRPGK